MLAFLTTSVTFELADGILNAKLGLERNLGMADRQFFFSGTVVHRFTPKSGLYVRYYGIKRSKTYSIQEDLIFLQDTIQVGALAESFFSTRVFSAGYLYTLASTPSAFFATYFNLYVLDVSAGLKADASVGLKANAIEYNQEIGITAPLPEVGVIGSFELAPWMQLNGGLGFFVLNTGNFGGQLNNLYLQFELIPLKWLRPALGYEQFVVKVRFPEGGVNTVVDYNFKGPTLGINFVF